MTTTWVRFLLTIAATLTTTVVAAQAGPFADLAEPAFSSFASEAAERAAPTVLVADSDFAPPRLEVGAALLYLQPGSGSLEYGTLVSPLPAPSPHWENQSIRPEFSPAFNLHVRFLVPETANDLRASWTHLDSTDRASFAGTPLQFAGPSYLIGPGATAYNVGSGTVNFRYESVNLEGGHLWRAGRPFQMRVFGGVQYTSVDQDLTGWFSDFSGSLTHQNTTQSSFLGAGPRVGVSGQFQRRRLQLLGEMAAVALVGTQHSRVNFNTTSAMFPGGSPQSFTSPSSTQVVPGLESRLASSYSLQLGGGVLKLEAGYQAVVYVDAVNSYNFTQVAVPPVVNNVGVFFATADHLQNNFTAHGPYMSLSWGF
ncbi:MAG: hypothetical protein JNL96_09290 [Planctomycetaceae bacterium]|nr:hypothetical protein [Planctomycetaceae bacterium]